MVPWIILVAVLLLLVALPVSIYNGLVRRRNGIANAQGAIDAVLKQRFDLLPNLVETVKRYAAHETGLFAGVVALRKGKNSYGELSADEKNAFDSGFGTGLRNFYAVAENYPDLKASDNFLHLQRTLNELEEQLSAARRTYNAVVTDYNNAVQVFPSSVIAGLFGFRPGRVLETPAEERGVPDVGNLFGDNRCGRQ